MQVRLTDFFLFLSGVLHRLFSKYIQLKRYDDAARVKEMCQEEGVIETSQMLAQTVQMFTATKNADEALEHLRKLNAEHPNFKVDEYKVIDLATLLTNENRFDEAIDTLQSMQPQKSKQTDFLISNVISLLKAARNYGVRHKTGENMAEQALNVLLSKKLCKPSNVNLGHIIMEYVEKKDLQTAVAAYIEYTKAFKETPQTIILISELLQIVNLGDAPNDYHMTKEQAVDYLQQIIDASSAVHGIEKTNVNVILSFANTGNVVGLRKIMLDPSMKFDEKQLMASLEYHKNQNKINVVISIARSVRGLSHIMFNEQHLYGLLLSHFIRENDFESAIQFYNELLKHCDGEIPKETAKTLANFLKRNKQEVPMKLRSFIN